MDLKEILSGVENSEELIRKIEAAVGKDYVPRSEFNEKNEKLKAFEAQVGELQNNVTKLSEEKASWEGQQEKLNQQIKGYEMAALKAKVAHEAGLPYELASRLTGQDEKTLKSDAAALAGFIKPVMPAQPLRTTEKGNEGASPQTSAYKTLLEKMNLGE